MGYVPVFHHSLNGRLWVLSQFDTIGKIGKQVFNNQVKMRMKRTKEECFSFKICPKAQEKSLESILGQRVSEDNLASPLL